MMKSTSCFKEDTSWSSFVIRAIIWLFCTNFILIFADAMEIQVDSESPILSSMVSAVVEKNLSDYNCLTSYYWLGLHFGFGRPKSLRPIQGNQAPHSGAFDAAASFELLICNPFTGLIYYSRPLKNTRVEFGILESAASQWVTPSYKDDASSLIYDGIFEIYLKSSTCIEVLSFSSNVETNVIKLLFLKAFDLPCYHSILSSWSSIQSLADVGRTSVCYVMSKRALYRLGGPRPVTELLVNSPFDSVEFVAFQWLPGGYILLLSTDYKLDFYFLDCYRMRSVAGAEDEGCLLTSIWDDPKIFPLGILASLPTAKIVVRPCMHSRNVIQGLVATLSDSMQSINTWSLSIYPWTLDLATGQLDLQEEEKIDESVRFWSFEKVLFFFPYDLLPGKSPFFQPVLLICEMTQSLPVTVLLVNLSTKKITCPFYRLTSIPSLCNFCPLSGRFLQRLSNGRLGIDHEVTIIMLQILMEFANFSAETEVVRHMSPMSLRQLARETFLQFIQGMIITCADAEGLSFDLTNFIDILKLYAAQA